MSLSSQSEALARMRGIRDALEEDPGRFYFPLAHQALYHLTPKRERALISGNQVGKSEAIKQEIRWMMRGDWPDWVRTGKAVPVWRNLDDPRGENPASREVQHDPARRALILEDWTRRIPGRRRVTNGPVKVRVMVPSYQGSAEGILDKLENAFPRGKSRSRKNPNGVKTKWWCEHVSGGESYLEVLSNEGLELSGEGWVGDAYIMDEPSSQAMYGAHKRGLMRRQGFVLMSLTPLEGSSWIKEGFVDAALAGDEDRFALTVPIWANCDENGGFLTREAIIDFIDRSVVPSERRAREFGEFLHIGGTVFDEFRMEAHTWGSEERWGDENWWRDACYYVVVDPHPGRAPVALLFASGPDDRRFVLDEYPRVWADGSPYRYRDDIRDSHDVERFVAEVTKMLAAHSLRPSDVRDYIIDPRGGAMMYDGQSFADKMTELGMPCCPAPVNRRTRETETEEGIYLLREWLRWDEAQALDANNHPMLGIHARCHNTIWAFANWRAEEVHGKTDTKLASEKRYSEVGKDQIDCGRYGAFHGLDWVPSLAPPAARELFTGMPGG